MVRHTSVFLLGLILSVCAWAQPKIGFTNLDGFPAVVANGTGYNLDGYIKNTGQDTLHTGVDIMMRVNNGPALSIQNNFSISSPLAPGDSVYWSKSGHNFPGGQFAPGNNDVIIWPTRMQGPQGSLEIDSLVKEMFYTDNAAFVLCKDPIVAFAEGIDISTRYNTTICASNEGTKSNENPVGAYLQIGNEPAKLISTIIEQVEPGQQFSIELQDFKLMDFVDLFSISEEELMDQPAVLWVAEVNKANAANTVSYEIYNSIVSAPAGVQPANDAVTLFPNPVNNILHFNYSSGIEAGEVQSIRIYNVLGQVKYAAASAVQEVDVHDLAAGQYFVRIETSRAQATLRFTKE